MTASETPSPRQDVRMDGVEFFRTTADGGVCRTLPSGRYSYCVFLRRGELDLEIDYPRAATVRLKAGDVVAVSGLVSHQFRPPAAAPSQTPFVLAAMDAPERGSTELIVGMVSNE